MEEKLPKTLYKYTSADTALKILLTSKIRFASPENFNDPFEINPPVEFVNCCQKNREILNKINFIEKYNYIIGKIFLSLKFFCLSGTKNSILMWSHYANMHKGVVIGFNTSNDIIQKCEKVIYKIGTIDIDKTIEKVEKLKNNIPTSDINNLELKQAQKALYCHKHRDWSYEKEYRCLYPFSEGELLNAIRGKGQKTEVFVQIPEESIKAVYLGCKISENDELAILNIIKSKYPNVKCYKVEKCPYAYKLKFNKINIE